MSSNSSIRQAVGMAVGAAGALASVGFSPFAFGADPAAAGPTPGASTDAALDEVVVTGSRIRRVDAETANPVFVIDAATIKDSGVTTVSDLVQRIPSVSGQAQNTNVNNGGGYGESNVELRGLEAKRTLVLLDGRRLGIVVGNSSDATDINQIPLNLVERVEVLKEGAGAVYGSDAVAGVVNFITRKNTDGVELHADYGRTGKNDGSHHTFDAIFGTTTDKWNFEAGGSYLKQDAVYAGARNYSKYALYLYGGTTGAYKSGSSRTPTGRIFLPAAVSAAYGGCGSVTRTGPLSGLGGPSGSAAGDYRCFDGGTDRFNYQPFNLLTTPIERSQAFTKLSYEINDYATVYSSFIYNRTHTDAEEAALPFDAQADDVVISANSVYNPFGIPFGGLTTGNNNALFRLSGFGDRVIKADTQSEVFSGGVKGKMGETGWNYDFSVGYSRLDANQSNDGYYLKSALQAAVGPSFIDPATGAATCGVAGAPVANCTPLNIFNIFAPGQAAVLSGLAENLIKQSTYEYKTVGLDFDGSLFSLPAGAVQASVGFDYKGNAGDFTVDGLANASPPLYLTCLVSNEQCSSSDRGHYSSKEEYLELFIPILKDLPGVQALNIDAGVRHSDYSLFGSTTKSDFKVEYRPVKDLLVRGTFSQVFRVPTINDLYQAPVSTSITFNDPCQGLTAAKVAATPNLALACKGVPLDGTFAEPNGQVTGLQTGNTQLKPESGIVKTVGFVFDPSFVPGLSFDATYWDYKLSNLINLVQGPYSQSQCVATGQAQFCNLATRFVGGANAGQIEVLQEPTSNLGTLVTNGIDVGLHYSLKNTPVGSFQAAFDVTHTMSYLNTPAPGAAPQQIAGTYLLQFGNFAKTRGLATLGWTLDGADSLITARYIGKLQVTNPSVLGTDATGAPFPPLLIGSVVYVDAELGYTFPTRTKVQVGIRNLADKQPPIFYQNNVENANTDVNTYDTLGRQWWIGFTQKL